MRRYFPLLLACCIVLAGCDSADLEAPSGPEAVRIDLQWNFEDDFVEIELDGDLVFAERVTTNDLLSLAKIVDYSLPAGEHTVHAVVNGRYHAAAQFVAGSIAVVAIRFDGGRKEVEIELSEEPFWYD